MKRLLLLILHFQLTRMEKNIMKRAVLLSLLLPFAVAYGMQPAQPSKAYRYTGKALKVVGGLGALGISMYGIGFFESLKDRAPKIDAPKQETQEKTTIEKVAKDGADLFLKTKKQTYPFADLYRFHLSLNNTPNMQESDVEEENAHIIAAAMMMCEKEIPNEEPNSCELVRLHVLNSTQRSKGYGSFFLQHILNYLRKNSGVQELGLFAEPSADSGYEAATLAEREQSLKRLDGFYRKNGFQEVEGFSGAFVFNLKDNKI